VETGVNEALFIPPGESIHNMFGVGAEILIQLITKFRLQRSRECWQIIEEIFA